MRHYKQGLWLLWMIILHFAAGLAKESSYREKPFSRQRMAHDQEASEKLTNVKERETTISPTTVAEDDDDKKTLAQQVVDGKYGLIQKEIFSKPPKRPGIISYEANPEVPKDNVNNLGGLQPEEIWLAENHLLVLKGGGFKEKESNGKDGWPPIDNYVAPKRPVKIPQNPKVPPPFPIQLKDGGPIEFIRGSGGNITGDPLPPPPFGLPFLPPPHFNRSGQGNFTPGNGPPPFPFPPFGFPPPPPFFPFPPGNISNVDEDDPRLYYPPPYDFVFNKDNSSHVPPGPLVPGIVLPPPPNFFAPLKPEPSKRPTQRPDKHNRKPPTKQTVTLTAPKRVTTPKVTVTTQPTVKIKPTTPLYFRENVTSTKPPLSTLSSINEVKSNDKHLPKIEIGEWIPIVGPSLCLLDGKNCYDIPIKTNNPVDAYALVYNTSSVEPYRAEINNNITPVNKLYTFTPRTRKYFSTTPTPYTDFKPIIVNPSVTTQQYNEVSDDNQYKQRETYYFYEEPVITEAKVIDAADYPQLTTSIPPVVFLKNGEQNKYETNTISPIQTFREENKRKPKVNKIKPSRLHIYEQELNKYVNSNLQLEYLFNGRPSLYSDQDGYSYQPPVDSSFRTYVPQKPKPTGKSSRNRHKYDNNRGKGQNPVFEYSFSAPGYGSKDSPKISSTIPTTTRPVEERDQSLTRFSYFDYISDQETDRFRQSSTIRPEYYSQPSPYRAPSPTQYPLYTHSDHEPIDDITKNYFTHFGKKINPDDYKFATTPMPPPKVYYNAFRERGRQSKKQNIRFPEDSAHRQQSYYNDDGYYYGGSLEGDVSVNYKDPVPPLEPEAEYIPSHRPHAPLRHRPRPPPSNAYISYQLPGNGGHFYFLTPQTVNAQNYHLASSGVRYPDPYNRIYYKRNAQFSRSKKTSQNDN